MLTKNDIDNDLKNEKKTKQINIRFTENELKKIKKRVNYLNIDFSKYVRLLIRKDLNDE